ncbi:hypothetical protein OIU79_025467 [Salix purpurea]|uniref:Uncharacterized protein n=1 Tax=Salix purpurea TaxID=77065 RepID=A0A9Q1A713_SALPP|nr:hypothetical protein OIU79_025467 [Salix purpurea]
MGFVIILSILRETEREREREGERERERFGSISLLISLRKWHAIPWIFIQTFKHIAQHQSSCPPPPPRPSHFLFTAIIITPSSLPLPRPPTTPLSLITSNFISQNQKPGKAEEGRRGRRGRRRRGKGKVLSFEKNKPAAFSSCNLFAI